MEIKNVGVIGAGTMGNGIAQVFAVNGRSVVLVDVDQGYLDRAMANMTKSVRRMAEKGGKDPAAAEADLKAKVRTRPTSSRWPASTSRSRRSSRTRT